MFSYGLSHAPAVCIGLLLVAGECTCLLDLFSINLFIFIFVKFHLRTFFFIDFRSSGWEGERGQQSERERDISVRRKQ